MTDRQINIFLPRCCSKLKYWISNNPMTHLDQENWGKCHQEVDYSDSKGHVRGKGGKCFRQDGIAVIQYYRPDEHTRDGKRYLACLHWYLWAVSKDVQKGGIFYQTAAALPLQGWLRLLVDGIRAKQALGISSPSLWPLMLAREERIRQEEVPRGVLVLLWCSSLKICPIELT